MVVKTKSKSKKLNSDRVSLSNIDEQHEKIKSTKSNNVDFCYIHWSKKGEPLATIQNLTILLNFKSISVRYNLISRNIEIKNPASMHHVNDLSEQIAELESIATQYYLPYSCVNRFILAIAKLDKYNPIANWILGKKWDSKDRLKGFFNTIDTTDHILRDIYMGRWLTSAVAAMFEPDFKFSTRGILCIYSEQDLGKTSWFQKMVPFELSDYIDVDVYIDPKDKDTIIQGSSNWMIEYGDIDGMLENISLARFKSFQTKRYDIFREPYGKKAEKHPRRFVAIGTVDKQQFLRDNNNTRFYCMEAIAINFKHNINMQQLYRQVYDTLYKKGYSWFLSQEEKLLQRAKNKDFNVENPLLDKINIYFNPSDIRKISMTVTEILEYMGYNNPDVNLAQKCGYALKEAGYLKNKSRKYEMPKSKLPCNKI